MKNNTYTIIDGIKIQHFWIREALKKAEQHFQTYHFMKNPKISFTLIQNAYQLKQNHELVESSVKNIYQKISTEIITELRDMDNLTDQMWNIFNVEFNNPNPNHDKLCLHAKILIDIINEHLSLEEKAFTKLNES